MRIRKISKKPDPEAGPQTHREENRGPSTKQQVLSILLIVTAAVLIAYVTKAFIVQPYIVDGQSMETTLQNHDRLIVNKLPLSFARLQGHQYTPARGDIIVFNQSGLPGFSANKQLIKRVIGLPGDRVVVKDGSITIYNKAHPSGFNPDKSGKYRTNSGTLGNVDLVLPKNQVFVCGDNRNNSEDSRFFGPINTNKIVGKLVLRIWPLSKAQHF